MNRILLTTFFLAMGRLGVSQVADGLTPLQRKQLTVLSEPATLYKGFVRIGYNLKYYKQGRVFDKNGTIRIPDTNYAGGTMENQLSVIYGISDRFQISVMLPHINSTIRNIQNFNQVGNQQISVKADVTTIGVKDLQTDFRFQFLKETNKLPSILGGITLSLPTANNERSILLDSTTFNSRIKDFTGGVGTTILTTLQLRKIIYPYLFAADFTYYFGGEGEIVQNGQAIEVVGVNSATWQLTAGMHLNEWITLSGKIFYHHFFIENNIEPNNIYSLFDYSTREFMYFIPTLTFQFGRLRCEQIISIPISGKNSSAESEYSASLLYTF